MLCKPWCAGKQVTRERIVLNMYRLHCVVAAFVQLSQTAQLNQMGIYNDIQRIYNCDEIQNDSLTPDKVLNVDLMQRDHQLTARLQLTLG